MPERMRFSRGRHIQTYEVASAAGVGVGMHSHGPRQSPRPLPPPARAIRLRPANHMRTQHRSTMPQAYGRLDRGLNSHHSLLLLPLRFCADARVHSPPHRPACAPPRLHQRPVAAGSSCLHLFTACIKYCRAPSQHAGHLGTTSVSIHVKQQQTYPKYVYVHRSVTGAGLRVEAVVDFDAGEGGAPCVSLRVVGRHSACARRTATGAAPGRVPACSARTSL